MQGRGSKLSMHLQQTKRGSIQSGGPQYYFHDLTDAVKTYLRAKGAVSVALVTPYGATKSDYLALSKDRKLDAQGRAIAGSVGHDRIQQGKSTESIGESVRRWYSLPRGDFERIDVEIDIVEDRFYLIPLQCKYANAKRAKGIAKIDRPLTFTAGYVSNFWRKQIREVNKAKPGLVAWCLVVFRGNLPNRKGPQAGYEAAAHPGNGHLASQRAPEALGNDLRRICRQGIRLFYDVPIPAIS